MKYIKGKENVVADALSRKCMLLTQLELNVVGFDHIKDLYEHDATFATPYAKCVTHTSWERYYIKDGYLMRAKNYAFLSLLFVCYLCKRLMEVDSWDTLDATRLSQRSPRTTFGPRCSATSHASPPDALHVAKLSLKLNHMVFTCLFLFLINLGKTLAWILYLVCLELKMERILCLLLWTDFLRWHISSLATR